MTTGTLEKTSPALDPALASRIVREGYGSGAWRGPDLAAAVAAVSATAAYHAGQIPLIKALHA